MMKVDLTGKVALVTGAGRNISLAIANLYAENGARVVYADILFDEAEKAAAEYPGCKAVAMNVADSQQVETVLAGVAQEFGHIDILVNNAGINTAKRVTIDEFPLEEWNRLLAVDLTGLYLVSKAAARVMLKQGSGRIINISSVLGLVPARLQCAFVAAKAGVVNLTKAMALELGGRGILVNCIAPGSILIESPKQLFYGDDPMYGREKAKAMLGSIPLGRPGKPEDIAYAALYLAAPESNYVTGQTMVVDGGWTAGYIRDF
jgi:NAD(P)-dependent dehydrogenase (short-subunit alcohol dehydrogenase family)